MTSSRGGHDITQSNTKNICTKFHEKIFNGSQKMRNISQNCPQNTQKWAPKQPNIVHSREKNDVKNVFSVVTVKKVLQTPVQKFMRKY